MKFFARVALPLALGALGLAAQAPGNAFFAGPSTSGASLHDTALLPGTSVLQGETVTTGPGGVAVLAPTSGAGGVVEMTGNASATVHADQLDLRQGTALVTGSVVVTTPQQQVFQPSRTGTSYVVNAGPSQSQMSVLTGAVNVVAPSRAQPAVVIPAGHAVEVATDGAGHIQMHAIVASQVRLPAANAAVPTPPQASQWR